MKQYIQPAVSAKIIAPISQLMGASNHIVSSEVGLKSWGNGTTLDSAM